MRREVGGGGWSGGAMLCEIRRRLEGTLGLLLCWP